jgi:putative exosortase-associated protein (TIGR04073 family)
MRNKVPFFLSLLAMCGLIVGCTSPGPTGPEQKFGRGLNNALEFARLGEIRRSIEQATVFDYSGEGGAAAGFFHGLNRSFARTGVGIYEMVTFPIPNHRYDDYGPIFFPAGPVYPDSYTPDWLADTTLEPDASLGFAGGDIAPFVPGSRFHVFNN